MSNENDNNSHPPDMRNEQNFTVPVSNNSQHTSNNAPNGAAGDSETDKPQGAREKLDVSLPSIATSRQVSSPEGKLSRSSSDNVGGSPKVTPTPRNVLTPDWSTAPSVADRRGTPVSPLTPQSVEAMRSMVNCREPFQSPKFILKTDMQASPLPPDSEEHVINESEIIIESFIRKERTLELEESESESDDLSLGLAAGGSCSSSSSSSGGPTAAAAAGAAAAASSSSNSARDLCRTELVGHQLAVIGDDINRRYCRQFDEMIQLLRIDPRNCGAYLSLSDQQTHEYCYRLFAEVARSLFENGRISWGRIVALLVFGYRLAVDTVQRGLPRFFTDIVHFLVRFLAQERIASWIAQQGGWIAVLSYVPESIGWATIGVVITGALLAAGLAFWFNQGPNST